MSRWGGSNEEREDAWELGCAITDSPAAVSHGEWQDPRGLGAVSEAGTLAQQREEHRGRDTRTWARSWTGGVCSMLQKPFGFPVCSPPVSGVS